MKLLLVATAALFSMGATGSALANEITFSSLPFGNPPVTSYTEDGFTFAVTAGSFDGTSGYGAPPPSVYTPNGSGTADITDGGLFTFSSVALGNGAFSGDADFTLTGLLGGTSVYSFTESVGASSFNTYSNTGNMATPIDDLRIAATGDANIDSIIVNPVVTVSAAPEPSIWALMMVGVAGLGLALRRSKVDVRRRLQVVAV